MSPKPPILKPSAMPAGPASRLFALGGLAASGLGHMVKESARQMSRGQTPDLTRLLFDETNGLRMAEQLARMRGAAMKVGQILSMDSGDILPAAFTQALSRLQQEAHIMPRDHLERVLRGAWGDDWRQHFVRFELTPFAAASIGQVHRAQLKTGEVLAIKVQFPNVTKTIDSDVANIAGLLKLLGVAQKVKDLPDLIETARVQLHEEADYLREAAQMERYAEALSDNPTFVVPRAHAALLRPNILPMDFVEGEPIETLTQAPAATRNQVMETLFGLALRELFDLRLMQTDPNFANFKWRPLTGQVVLLDFGATRAVPEATVEAYRALMQAGLNEDREGLIVALSDIGAVNDAVLTTHRVRLNAMLDIMIRHLRQPRLDFADRHFVPLIREKAHEIAMDQTTWQSPPADTLFVQRKISGMALLGVRTRAVIPLRGLVAQAIV